MSDALQPLLHDQEVVLAAPAQCWFASDGTMGDATIHGTYVCDIRVISTLHYRVGGQRGEHIATARLDAARSRITHLARNLDGTGADPDVRFDCERVATLDGLTDTLVVRSRLTTAFETTVELVITPDLSSMDDVKRGFAPAGVSGLEIGEGWVTWGAGSVRVRLDLPGAAISRNSGTVLALWPLTVPARGEASIHWSVSAVDTDAVVRGARSPSEWSGAGVTADDRRFERWITTSLNDLAALRLTTTRAPDDEFLAAGAPWFFTLFGRDSIWAARMMLPFGTRLAASTLRVLAALQGSAVVIDTAEQPGKIMHELRGSAPGLTGSHDPLPPLYYGTIDATPLWVCLLVDAWHWGMPDREIEALLPHLEAALAWMRDFGDADGDGLLEYVDMSGRGLANQGWKDSGDSIQFADGTLAAGPIALVEVQAYAYEAALGGADVLDHFGRTGGDEWRAWAAALREKFHEKYWLEDSKGVYLAIALDAQKRPVDSVTSNGGHVLGSGILTPAQAESVAQRLVESDLSSGYGLRTMSSTAAGFWPLSYHGGSVWAHDTAIAIAGMTKEGCTAQADLLIGGLLASAEGFSSRMPELQSGERIENAPVPVPYPAACRPQAWSAAASAVVLASVLGLEIDGDTLTTSPRTTLGAISVNGLRFRGRSLSVSIDGAGQSTIAESPSATL